MTTPSPPSPALPLAPLAYASQPISPIPADWTNIDILALREDQLAPFLRLLLLVQSIFTFLVGSVCVIMLSTIRHTLFDLAFNFILVFAVLTLTSVIGLLRAVSRTKLQWRQYRLILADQGLLVCNARQSPARVHREHVRRITETWDAFRIRLPSGNVTISKRIESPDRLRQRLASWQPIVPGKGALGVAASVAYLLLLFGGQISSFVLGLTSPRPRLVVACIALAFCCTILMFLRTIREKTRPLYIRLAPLILLLYCALLLWRLFTM